MTTRTLLAVGFVIAAGGAAARATVPPRDPQTSGEGKVARGSYLVAALNCAFCHTPHTEGPRGREPDASRALSGHPQDITLPAPPPAPQPGPWRPRWTAATQTAFAGNKGTSFAANLTPDPDTGIGQWTARIFVETIRTGRRLGRGRPLLPPMPYKAIGSLSDDDLEAIFAYLQTLPPVKNRVPEPASPKEENQRIKSQESP